jgi:putative endonuclease
MCSLKNGMPYFVYIVRCSDNRLYVGHTTEVGARVRRHNDGKGAVFTARRRPVHLVYSESYDSHAAAIAREQQLKRWSAAKKEALIASDGLRLNRLSRRGGAGRLRS